MRPTAWQWDGLARWLQLAGVGALAALGIAAASGSAVFVVAWAVLVVLAFAASFVMIALSSRTASRERDAGYSTVYDATGFELRDPRTLEVVRARDVAPVEESRIPRSLVLGILTTSLDRLPKPDAPKSDS